MEITVVTPENPEYPEIDEKLCQEIPENIRIVKVKTKEPFNVYKKLTGTKSIKAGFFNERKKNTLLQNIFIWIRGNFFIPDARKGWVGPAVDYIKNHYKQYHWDIVITTGPPHSTHIIGLKLKTLFKNLIWITDFRDPWTQIDFFHKLMLWPHARYLHYRLEKKVICHSDAVICVGKNIMKYFMKLDEKNKNKFYFIPNGFDAEDFSNITPKEKNNDWIILTHNGTVNADRNQPAFWEAFRDFLNENQSMKKKIIIRLVGRADTEVLNSISNNKIDEYVQIIPYVDHNKSIEYLMESDYLLLFINRVPHAKGILTGKIFEYIGSGKPIICIGPKDGEASMIIEETSSGICIEFDDKVAIKKVFEEIAKGNFTKQNHNQSRSNYSREALTQKLWSVIDTLTSKK
ncbi:MAG: hypothetical protein N3F09_06285 [Bacteroidia bacterium]|nr:hypothetical protein [Bacteroidia bacterium]